MIQELIQTYLSHLSSKQPVYQKKPFRAFVKEVYSGGSYLLLTDGYHEIRAKLLPAARTFLKEQYPFFCQLESKNNALEGFLVCVHKYDFVSQQMREFAFAPSQMQIGVEIEKMTIIVAQKTSLCEILTRSGRNRQTNEPITYIKKTQYISQDKETQQYIKYYLHHFVKRQAFEAVRHDPLVKFQKV